MDRVTNERIDLSIYVFFWLSKIHVSQSSKVYCPKITIQKRSLILSEYRGHKTNFLSLLADLFRWLLLIIILLHFRDMFMFGGLLPNMIYYKSPSIFIYLYFIMGKILKLLNLNVENKYGYQVSFDKIQILNHNIINKYY